MTTPSSNLDTRKELNGFGSYSKKRPLEDEGDSPWRSRPTAIKQPSNAPHSNHPVIINPYNRISGSHSLGHGRENPNPTARQTITNNGLARPYKKQKLASPQLTDNNRVNSRLSYSDHYGPGHAPERYPATCNSSGSRPVSFHVSVTSPGDGSSASGSTNEHRTDIISIEDDERDAELPVRHDARVVSLRNARENESPSLRNLGIGEPGPSHSTSFGLLAEDGKSTVRLRQRFANNSSQDVRNLCTSIPDYSISVYEDNSDDIEDAGVLSAPEPNTSPNSPKRSSPLPRQRHSTPGDTVLSLQTVPKKRSLFKKNANAKSQYHITDLRKQGLKARMRGKQPDKTKSRTESLKPNSNADKDFPFRCKESKSTLLASPTLPLEALVWGKTIHEISQNSLKPEYWLVWDEATADLQVQKDPVEIKSARKRPYKSVKLSSLRGHSLTYSNDANEKLLKIIPTSRCGISDDICLIGLTFKFLNNHPNLQYYEDMYRLLKAIANEDDTETVIGSAVRQCLDASKRVSEAYAADTNKGRLSASTSKQPRMQSKERPTELEVHEFKLTQTRRSSRLSGQAPMEENIFTQPDELILVFPPSGPGAINVMQSDLGRLEPSEFLNDTIIEIALKFWINDLRAIDPMLADDIHVFSCFFYKKLANKNFDESYKSIRKWTSKVDIFKKRYIIVPINENVHWYLIIIYLPEHILVPAPELDPPPQSTRRMLTRRVLAETARPYDKDDNLLESANFGALQPADNGTGKDNDKTDSNITINGVVASTRSCSLNDSAKGGNGAQQPDCPPEPELAYPSELDNEQLNEADYIRGNGKALHESDDAATFQLGNTAWGGPSVGTAIVTDSESEVLHELDDAESAAMRTFNNGDGLSTMEVDDRLIQVSDDGEAASVPTSTFYADLPPSSTTRASSPLSQTVIPDHKEDDASLDEIDLLGQPEVIKRPRTWIFAMDSLGTKHKLAMKRLNRYLCMEAKDKKGIENPSEALELNATVPVQPNYCDCGLYLLHFAKTFVSDTEKIRTALCHAPKKMSKDERDELWRSSQVSTMREDLKARILEESEKWKAVKQQQKEAQQQKEQSAGDDGSRSSIPIESSDDEIEVTQIVHRGDSGTGSIVTPKRGGRKSGITYGRLGSGSSKASRLRG